MDILLDTHTLLWFLEDNPSLTPEVKELIEDMENTIYVSIISFYEISIKLSIGKLRLPDTLNDTIQKTIASDISIIEMNTEHVVAYQEIPVNPNHRDPFDRMLIATAVHEDCYLISADGKFKDYSSILKLISIQ